MSIDERWYDTDLRVVVFQPTKYVGGQSEHGREYDHSTCFAILSSGNRQRVHLDLSFLSDI